MSITQGSKREAEAQMEIYRDLNLAVVKLIQLCAQLLSSLLCWRLKSIGQTFGEGKIDIKGV